jgi:hypothetical protein
MRFFVAVSLFFVFFTSSPVLAGSKVCIDAFKSLGVPLTSNLRIDTVTPNIKYINNRGKQYLKNLSDEHRHNHGINVNGLTVASFESSISGNFTMINLKNGYSCVFPKEIIIRLGYDTMDVYVARDFQPGSCEYNQTLQHENQHVEINFTTFNKYKRISRIELNNYIRDNFPIVISTSTATQSASQSGINDVFFRVMKKMERERNGLHRQIDSPQNYKAIQSRCSNW